MRGRLAAALFVAASALLCLVATPTAQVDASQSEPSWTVMVYMANDFSVSLPWLENINSMEAAAQADSVNVIVLVDNPEDDDSVLLKIEHDASGAAGVSIVSTGIDDGGAVIPVAGEVDMADPTTLTDFIAFSATEFPADRLVLVLWGHGAGWRGLCPDNSGLLTLPQLGEALEDAVSIIGRNLDMVIVDACAEATLEMIAEVGPYTDYFVGAQNDVPYQGLPYEGILGALTAYPGQSVEDFGSTVVSQYIEYAWYVSPYSATMAAFDLARMDDVFSLLDALSAQGVKYSSIFHDVINDALASAEYYDTEWYVDLVDFLTMIHESNLPLEMRMLALETAVAFREAIVSFEKYDHPDPYDGIGVERANGAVVYAPTTSYYEAEYYSLMLSTTGHWDEFGTLARMVMPTEPMAPGPSLSYSDSDGDGLGDTAFLEWEADHPLVEAWVYGQLPNGIYLQSCEVSANSIISIHGPVGNLVIAASAVDSEGNAVSYSMVNATLFARMELRVILTVDGESVGDRLDVQVMSSTYSGYAVLDGDAHVVTLTVPTQAAVGEMILVRVMSGQDVLLDARHVVYGKNSTLTIDLHATSKTATIDEAVLLVFSLLPAALLGLFTVLLYMDYRKTKRKA